MQDVGISNMFHPLSQSMQYCPPSKRPLIQLTLKIVNTFSNIQRHI